MYKFENEVMVTVHSGSGELLTEWSGENAISDDILGAYGHIYNTPFANSTGPYCFLLPDGSNWSGFAYDRMNPSAPYCITANNSIDTGADNQWKPRQTYTAPANVVTGRHKLFFSWNNLPLDFQLKAIGLTGWQSTTSGGDMDDYNFGAGASVNQQPTVFIPQTLVVLPASILVHGRNGGAGTPDVLQVSYFLSIVGTS